ncbi:MAG: hypothetical protein RMJ55_17965 [Roseiflexaceae bacterium]|nr:hypothetical protein [Roseiflexus sp.]MDW8215442.1 hypothetical protein [Roseiflexaceae bacterium]
MRTQRFLHAAADTPQRQERRRVCSAVGGHGYVKTAPVERIDGILDVSRVVLEQLLSGTSA